MSRDASVASGSDQRRGKRLSRRLRALLRPVRDRAAGARERLKDGAAWVEGAVRRPARQGPGRHVLVVDDLVPDPLFGFGFPRMFEVVQSLARAGHRVAVYPMASSPHEVERVDRLCGGRVRIYRGEGARGLRRLLWRKGAGLDLLFVSRPTPMRAFNEARLPPSRRPARVVYDLEAVTTPREAGRRRLFGLPWSPREEDRALAAELEVARGADAAAVVGDADGALVRSRLDLSTFTLSYPVPVTPSGAGVADRAGFLFVGRMTGPATEYPNVDAVRWFVAQVMPRLDALLGTGYRVDLVGLFDGEAGALASDRVTLHGAVDDLAPFYDRARVFVAPTRYAAGLPIKVVETIGRGLPCVTTPLLARQVGAEGHGFATDPSAEAFAERCALLHADEDAWRAARDYGLTLARERFSQEAFDATLSELVGATDVRP